MNIFDMIGTKTEEIKQEQKKKTGTKKESVEKAEENKNIVKTQVQAKYKFPFQVYFAGEMHDMTGAFENDKEYTADEITKTMLANHYFEFAGTVTYDYNEELNAVIAMFAQHKKG